MTERVVFDRKRTALPLMDLQNDIVGRGSPLAPTEDEPFERIESAMAAAAKSADAARAADIPVIHGAVGRKAGQPQAFPHGPLQQLIINSNVLIEGTVGFEFHPLIQKQEGEAVIVKRGLSALAGTELGPMLRGRGIDTIVLCGFATHIVMDLAAPGKAWIRLPGDRPGGLLRIGRPRPPRSRTGEPAHARHRDGQRRFRCGPEGVDPPSAMRLGVQWGYQSLTH